MNIHVPVILVAEESNFKECYNYSLEYMPYTRWWCHIPYYLTSSAVVCLCIGWFISHFIEASARHTDNIEDSN